MSKHANDVMARLPADWMARAQRRLAEAQETAARYEEERMRVALVASETCVGDSPEFLRASARYREARDEVRRWKQAIQENAPILAARGES